MRTDFAMHLTHTLTLTIVIALIHGCAPATQTAPIEEVAPGRPQTLSEVFDPALHRADDLYDRAQERLAQLDVPSEFLIEAPDSAQSDSVVVREPLEVQLFTWAPRGYRVQLIQTLDRQTALRRKIEAASQFPQDSVYVVLRGATYRVRVGDFTVEQDAEAKVLEAKAIGYRNAFPVPDRVKVWLVPPVEQPESVDVPHRERLR